MNYDDGQPPITYDRSKTSRKLLKRLADIRFWVVLWLITLVLSVVVDVALYKMIEYFTDSFTQENHDLIVPSAVRTVVFAVIIMLIQGLLKGAEFYLTNRVGQDLIMRLRGEIFNHLQILGLDFFESRRTGRIMSFVTNDVIRIREFAGKQMPILIRSPIAIVAFLGVMIYHSWSLTLAAICILPLIIMVVQIAAKYTRIAAMSVQATLADVSGELQEGIAGIQVVRSFANEAFEILKFGKANRGAYNAEMVRAKIEAILAPVLNLTGAIGLAILLIYGAWQVSNDIITFGQFAMIIALLHRTSEEGKHLSRTYMAFQDTLAASDRVFAFTEIKPSIVDSPGASELKSCEGRVEFRNLSFRYNDGEYVLKDINLTADPGRVIGLVGPSGGGKTSLAKLIPRFYDPVEGQVLLDGRDIRELKIEDLRNQLGIVPQETMLFHGTIRDNVAYGRLDATDDEIIAASKAANAHEFILALEKGYETLVGERGTKLSGGQRQRISIARALLKDPKILILDEATSNLDTESEKLVQAALEKLMVGRTTFVIAHRLSTIRKADEIVVIKAGRIVDRGTHEQLFSRDGVYRELYMTEETLKA